MAIPQATIKNYSTILMGGTKKSKKKVKKKSKNRK